MPAIDFRKIGQPDEAVDYIAESLNRQLTAGRQILWLLSGGSAVPLAVTARQKLQLAGSLSVSLCDERFVPVGDIASNWCQLTQQGFDVTGIRTFPVLQGRDFEETTKDFNAFLAGSLSQYDYIFALLGMGADGHTSGILPNSGLSESRAYAASYQGPDFQRITTTPHYLRQIDEAVVYAIGSSKHKAIDDLSTDNLLEEQPVQIIKSMKKVTFINDYKGGAL